MDIIEEVRRLQDAIDSGALAPPGGDGADAARRTPAKGARA